MVRRLPFVQNPKPKTQNPKRDGYCPHYAITHTEAPFPLVGWGTVEDRTANDRETEGAAELEAFYDATLERV